MPNLAEIRNAAVQVSGALVGSGIAFSTTPEKTVPTEAFIRDSVVGYAMVGIVATDLLTDRQKSHSLIGDAVDGFTMACVATMPAYLDHILQAPFDAATIIPAAIVGIGVARAGISAVKVFQRVKHFNADNVQIKNYEQKKKTLRPFIYPAIDKDKPYNPMCHDGQARATWWASRILRGELDPQELKKKAFKAERALEHGADTNKGNLIALIVFRNSQNGGLVQFTNEEGDFIGNDGKVHNIHERKYRRLLDQLRRTGDNP